jgi:hypothetical protein
VANIGGFALGLRRFAEVGAATINGADRLEFDIYVQADYPWQCDFSLYVTSSFLSQLMHTELALS